MRKNSIKNTRINGEVLKELSAIIQMEIKDPRIAPMTSVVSVEVAPDLKTCKAWISVLGDEKAASDTLAGLLSASGYIRRELARRVNLRNTPEIEFILDQSIEYGVSMTRKIDEVIGADELSAQARGEEIFAADGEAAETAYDDDAEEETAGDDDEEKSIAGEDNA